MSLDEAIAEAEEKPAAYVVASVCGTFLYKGSGRNLKERLKDHRAGRVCRTKNRRPLSLVYRQYFETYTEARKKEIFLKSGQGRAWLKGHLSRQL